jgi:hypothetical protein
MLFGQSQSVFWNAQFVNVQFDCVTFAIVAGV